MISTTEQEIRTFRRRLPWRFRFGLRTYGEHRFADMLPVIERRLGPDAVLIAKSLDPDPHGLEFVGIFALVPGRPLRLVWDIYLRPGEAKILARYLAAGRPVATGFIETPFADRRWQWAWTQTWEPGSGEEAPMQLYDRRGRLAVREGETLLLDRLQLRIPIAAIDHLFIGLSSGLCRRWIDICLQEGGTVRLLKQKTYAPLVDVCYDAWALINDSAWLGKVAGRLGQELGVPYEWDRLYWTEDAA